MIQPRLPGMPTTADPDDPTDVGDSWRSPKCVLSPARAYSQIIGWRGHIALDPCTGPGSIVDAVTEVRLPDDGLAHDWRDLVRKQAAMDGPFGLLAWVNPPYSDPAPWLARCASMARPYPYALHIIALVFAQTSDGWWTWGDAVCFWRGRLRFTDTTGAKHFTAPKPSALIYFGPHPEIFEHCYAPYGAVVRSTNVTDRSPR